ncbi:hypothetical protein E2C01_083355 [Portunus trituberculatus]|uniref:Uncharacterized protein n=1 Tax=Portunus trituberculatus TaxID=210409 RepID=A0A5B7J1T0_PORTR|nr:hypothetical protein [Portunus trituberculatus]
MKLSPKSQSTVGPLASFGLWKDAVLTGGVVGVRAWFNSEECEKSPFSNLPQWLVGFLKALVPVNSLSSVSSVSAFCSPLPCSFSQSDEVQPLVGEGVGRLHWAWVWVW